MQYVIASIVGMLISTFLVSRLVLWVMRSWDRKITKLATVHVFSWQVATFMGGIGVADGRAFAGIEMAATYFIPQAIWFVVDTMRYRRKTRRAVKAAQRSN